MQFQIPTDHSDLSLFLENLRHAVVLVSPEGIILQNNPSFQSLFARELFSSDDIFKVFRHNPELSHALKKIIETRGSYYLRDSLVYTDSKVPRSMDVEIFPLIDSHGSLFAVSLLFRDRSSLVRFEEQEKRNDRMGYLAMIASGLAHEIRNPLSGIKGASQLLSEELTDKGELKEYADIIQKEVDRVDRLVDDLLHLTKPRAMNRRAVNINQVLHDLMVLQKTVGAVSIKYSEQFDPSLPHVQGDEAALSQVFLNLIKNARQALAKDGHVIVRSRMVTDFGLRTQDKKKMFLAVDVEDNGKGMTPDEMSKIFVPFFTTKAQGSGLGLALCQQIVEEHEGTILVKSEPGRGSVFSVLLPV